MTNQTDSTQWTRLGNSELFVSRIALGCWPMSGISSLGITDSQSIATIHAALDHGINFFDTAYSYGYDGRSDRVLARALQGKRDRAIIAHKVGCSWDSHQKKEVDGRPQTLLLNAQEALKRLDTDFVDIMYLHTPDPNVPIEESAGAIAEICKRGWARYAAVSNVDSEQAAQFAQVCPIVAIQPHFNMFQQEAVHELLPFARSQNVAMVCYWILMKGLLSGHLKRDHVFDPSDRRLSYPIFQGKAWQHSQNILDLLRRMAHEREYTVAQLVLAWSLAQPGVDVALCGARRPEQILESAYAMQIPLDSEAVQAIDGWLLSSSKHE